MFLTITKENLRQVKEKPKKNKCCLAKKRPEIRDGFSLSLIVRVFISPQSHLLLDVFFIPSILRGFLFAEISMPPPPPPQLFYPPFSSLCYSLALFFYFHVPWNFYILLLCRYFRLETLVVTIVMSFLE